MTTLVCTTNVTAVNATADALFSTGLEDTFINSFSQTADNSAANTLSIRQDQTINALLYFGDFVPEIPASQTIDSATIYLRIRQNNWTTAGDTAVHRLLVDWDDAQANWTDRLTSTTWTTAGAQSDGNDRVATASDTVNIPVPPGDVYFAFDVTTDVADMYAGSVSNFGWVYETISGGALMDIDSFEGPDQDRPELVIVYSAAAASNNKRPLAGYGGLAGPNGGLVYVG